MTASADSRRVGKAARLRGVPTRHALRTLRPGRVGTRPKRAALPTLRSADEVIE
jgi:hypothetical protein